MIPLPLLPLYFIPINYKIFHSYLNRFVYKWSKETLKFIKDPYTSKINL